MTDSVSNVVVQLGGIDAITYVSLSLSVYSKTVAYAWVITNHLVQYAPILFSQAGLTSDNASFLASGVASILMFAISIPGFMLADKWGRRTSAISGGVLLSGCMLLIGSLYAAGAVHPYGFARWVVIVAVFAFGLIFCATWMIVCRIWYVLCESSLF